MRYKVITAVRNCPDHLDRCLKVLSDQAGDYDVCVVDDASTDHTPEVAKEWCRKYGWEFIGQDEWKGALYNQVEAINRICDDDDDVIVFCDGDDRLASNRVFDVLDRHYADNTKLTYGNYKSDPYDPGCPKVRPFPKDVVQENRYRKFILPAELGGESGGHLFNHLRTFKYELFRQLDEADFLDDKGRWFTNTPDTVLMVPCLELARGEVKCLKEVLLIYTSDMAHAEWRNITDKIDHVNLTVLRRPPKVGPNVVESGPFRAAR